MKYYGLSVHTQQLGYRYFFFINMMYRKMLSNPSDAKPVSCHLIVFPVANAASSVKAKTTQKSSTTVAAGGMNTTFCNI